MSTYQPRMQHLGPFLRARREATPSPDRTRSRTPGLRRDDVAALSAISVDYYTRLEQGRAASMPSLAVTDALADALQLSAAERAHLHRLTGRAAPEADESDDPAPGLEFLVRSLGDIPAQIVNDLGYILAQNSAADRVFPWAVMDRPKCANVYEYWFCNQSVRAAFPEERREAYSAEQAGELRAAVARRDQRKDPRGQQFVAALMAASEEFLHAWNAQHVFDGRDKQIWTAAADKSALQAHVTVDNHSNQRLVAFEFITTGEN